MEQGYIECLGDGLYSDMGQMFCMNIIVADDSFKKGKMHGIILLFDADGLLSDERLPLNRNEHGHVAYFYREWYDTIGICNNAFVYFGSPSPCCIAPFSSALEIYVKLFVTMANKCFQMCNRQKPIELSEIWVDKVVYKRGSLSYEGNNGCILIDYITLRDNVDATMKLSLESPKDPLLKTCVFGCIFAYYGDMLDHLDGLRECCYKAIFFKAAKDGPELDVGPLPLKKSIVAISSMAPFSLKHVSLMSLEKLYCEKNADSMRRPKIAASGVCP